MKPEENNKMEDEAEENLALKEISENVQEIG